MTISAALLYQIMHLAVGALSIHFAYRLFLVAGAVRPSREATEPRSDERYGNPYVPAYILTALGIVVIGIAVARGGADTAVDKTLATLLKPTGPTREPETACRIWELLLGRAEGKDVALWYLTCSELDDLREKRDSLEAQVRTVQQEMERLQRKLSDFERRASAIKKPGEPKPQTGASQKTTDSPKASKSSPDPPAPVVDSSAQRRRSFAPLPLATLAGMAPCQI